MTKIDPLDCLRITSVHSESFLFTLVEAAVLLAEVERLRGEAERERAAVVAWLRKERTYGTDDLLGAGFATVLGILAEAVEKGEHIREGEE